MSVRVSDNTNVCLYCSTTGTAFGPVFACDFDAHEFLEWLDVKTLVDPRNIPWRELSALKVEWENQRDGEPSDVEQYGAGAR